VRTPPEESRLTTLLRGLMAEILGLEDVGREEDFFLLGGDSLSALRFLGAIGAATGVHLPFSALMAEPTPEGLARRVTDSRNGAESSRRPIDLEDEARLPGDIAPVAASPARPAAERSILLTGATGFLGAHLLRELLDTGRETIVCLVRAESPAGGMERIQAALADLALPANDLEGRVRAIPADLGAPLLGLEAGEFQALAREVGVILHAAASTRFFRSYAALAPVNVGGTREMLRLACAGRAVAFHLISTIGVIGAGTTGRCVDEETPLATFRDVRGAYPMTKWIAESMVREAGARGLSVTIHRPGRLVASSRTGKWKEDDLAFRFFAGCLQLGSMPDLDVPLDATPVDRVAAAVVALSRRPDHAGCTFHLHQPRPRRTLEVAEALGRLGHPLERLPLAEWREKAVAAAARKRDHPLHPLLPLLMDEEALPLQAGDGCGNDLPPPIGNERTLAALGEVGVSLAPIDEAALARLLLHLHES